MECRRLCFWVSLENTVLLSPPGSHKHAGMFLQSRESGLTYEVDAGSLDWDPEGRLHFLPPFDLLEHIQQNRKKVYFLPQLSTESRVKGTEMVEGFWSRKRK